MTRQTDLPLDSQRLARLLDQQEIRDVYCRYCRGIDRRQFDLVRSCYHPDATDQHGEYVGDVDGFIEHVQQTSTRFDRTMHFLGNILVEVDGDWARGEAYAMAYHSLPAGTKPARYMEPASESLYQFTEHHRMGRADHDDPVFVPTLTGVLMQEERST